MYLDYFGLSEPPFSIAPDPRYLFMSERHREALAHLLYGVQGQGGFIVLTGEVGTGKTTICRCFLNQVPKNTDVAFIVNPKLSAHELLATICDEFHIDYTENASIKALNDAINDYLLIAHAEKRHPVLIIDEAQNLEPDVLEQLRLLTNLETSEKKLLQIILLGQPELRDMLAQKELRQLAQRITARYHLLELNRVEVGAYVACRLAVAGRRPRLFSDAAIKQLYKFSGGIPRLINLLADRALLGAYATQAETVDPTHVKRAHYEIRGESGSAWDKFIRDYGYRVIGASLALVLFVGLGVWSKPILDSFSPYSGSLSTVSPETDSVKDSIVTNDSIPPNDVQVEAQSDEVLSGAIEPTASGIKHDTSMLGPIYADAAIEEGGDSPKIDYINDFANALSTNPESLVAYVEVPSPDTRLFSAVSEKTSEPLEEAPREVASSGLGLRERNSKDKLQAFQSVFEAWNLNYSETPFRLACEFAELNGLACLHKQGNWRSLLRIDRPAVLTLFNDMGQKIHVALLKIEGEQALVAHAGERFTTSLDEIDRFWLGEYSVIWKLPPYKSGIIKPGQKKEGDWLQAGLAQINPQLEGLPLQEQVVEFQRSMGLVPDGIAGSMTLIQMNNILNVRTPKLLGKS
jgi:general secretion pathway protein A